MLVALEDGARLKPRGLRKGLEGIEVRDKIITPFG
jgi:hypothetical protein